MRLVRSVDVYLTAPEASLAASTAVGSIAFRQDIGPALVAAGNYRVRVTATGFVSVPPGAYNVKVAAAGTTTSVISANLSLQPAVRYTGLAPTLAGVPFKAIPASRSCPPARRFHFLSTAIGMATGPACIRYRAGTTAGRWE